ncbi:RagB/SusD family nutrient uptake outer membrane protein [Flavobacterium sp. F-65]|uniref:RagB/SusD family nutrient uptake outer membrane protein n=1 Tax=Flavobacterium pisciphilum TaxID=2893755 RepID=A0ABS8N0D0_9FLAO|nr:RagB/SusD family nutrient uptake outer membrane protein [Flavobacterium sp. F-65]MCC9073530.1 RagB/SusD family nutrient uptake outer membrane protein [Flavobacterium sp. F-65]
MKTLYKKKNGYWLIAKKIFFLSFTFSMPACDSFLEVDLPKSQLTDVAVFQEYTTANAAMADIYAKIRDRGLLTGTAFGLTNYLGNYADELTFYGAATNPAFAFYTNTVLPSNTNIGTLWNNSYNQIYAVNAVLEGVRPSMLTVQEKAQLEGEALFLRGLLHFYLLQLFGDIPYIQTTDYRVNSIVTKMPKSEVYTYILNDLRTAEDLLLPNYSSTERVRANSFVVKALLARVYLYKGSWDDANKKATAVIENNSLYIFENTLSKVFLKNSTEAIWQFMPTAVGKNTDEGAFFTFAFGPPPMVALSESLMSSFATNDLRKTSWTTPISKGSSTWYYASKYKEPRSTATSREYSIVLRLTEQYLIRAEARAELGNIIGAKEDLNKIRNRAGLSDTGASSKEQILEEILEQRRKELFTEYGHRFFDLKRTGKLDAVLFIKPGWNTTDVLLPLPENELTLNPNLKPQNLGY